MGVVYKARQIGLKRLVALKMILGRDDATEQALARFRHEAEAIARLRHPHIVQVYEIGEAEGRPFFSLEFVDGGSLAERLRGTPLPPRQAAELAEVLARAVHAAHQEGIVHRDLKPANVLLAADGTPKITDFGLAKRLDDDSGQTLPGQVMGTPSYMAPEQAAGKVKEVGPLADVYALGAILYELLTGRPPFRGVTAHETLHQVLTEEPVPPSRLQPKTPRDLETICLECLRKEPRKRYRDALALAEDCAAYLKGEPIRARPVGPLGRLGRWCRRNPVVAGLAGLAALLLAGLFAVITVSHVRTSAALGREQTANGLAAQRLQAALTAQAGEAEQTRLAERRGDEIQEKLARLHVAAGTRQEEEGDLSGALLSLTEALRRDPRREETHRLRLAMVLRQCPRPVRVWFHQDGVSHVEFSRDGRYLVTASKDGTARVWDVAADAPVAELRHMDAVAWAAFSPDGERVVTASTDGTARVWEAHTGTPLTPPLELHVPAAHAAFSPDGRRVIAAGGNKYGTAETRTQSIPGAMREQVIPQGPGRPPLRIPIPGPATTTTVTRQPHGRAGVWDAATGAPVGAKPIGLAGWLNQASFSPDGKRVLTAGARAAVAGLPRGEAMVWDVETGQPAGGRVEHPFEVIAAAWSPDGRRLVTAAGQALHGRGEARVWDADSGEALARPLEHNLQVVQASFSPDGGRVLTASQDGTARVWDAASGEPVTPPLSHGDRLTRAAFSPDGRRVLTAAQDGTACVWDAAGGERVTPLLHHGSPVLAAAFSPEGRRLATGAWDGSVRVWDLAASAGPPIPLRHQGAVLSTAFSADGRVLLTGSGQRGLLTITGPRLAVVRDSFETDRLSVWDPLTGTALGVPLAEQLPVTAAAVSPDGRRVVTVAAASAPGGGSEARLWEVGSGQPAGPPLHSAGAILWAGFAADGRCRAVAVTEKRGAEGSQPKVEWLAQAWDVATRQAASPPLAHGTRVVFAAGSPDGGRLVTGGADGAARVWEVSTGRPLADPFPHREPVLAAAFSPDGGRLLTVTGSEVADPERESAAHLWDLGTGRGLELVHRGQVLHAAFSPDGGQVVTAGADHAARVWDAATGQPVTPPLRHRGKVRHAAFSGDGRLVATAGEDRAARVWDAATGEPITPPLVHRDAVMGCAFSPDGGRLATACLDGAAWVWDLPHDRRASEELALLAQALAGRRLDDTGGLVPLGAAALGEAWRRARQQAPAEFTATPEQALTWHRQEAEDAERARQWPGVVLHLGPVIEAEPGAWQHRARLGTAYAELGRWDEAAAAYGEALAHGAEDAQVGRRLALAQLAAGRADDYRSTCRNLMARAGEAKDAESAAALARVCVLAPDALADLAPLLRLTEKPAAGAPRGGAFDVYAATLYRAGKPEEALQRLDEDRKAGRAADSPWHWLVLALAEQRLGHAAEAVRWLDQAGRWFDEAPLQKPNPSGRRDPFAWNRLSWEERLELQLLRREAEGRVKGAGGGQ
jgi:WD40 repeat protein/tetratricopeptide (TPR) repeat protein